MFSQFMLADFASTVAGLTVELFRRSLVPARSDTDGE
jgi:hypothetical protein